MKDNIITTDKVNNHIPFFAFVELADVFDSCPRRGDRHSFYSMTHQVCSQVLNKNSGFDDDEG